MTESFGKSLFVTQRPQGPILYKIYIAKLERRLFFLFPFFSKFTSTTILICRRSNKAYHLTPRSVTVVFLQMILKVINHFFLQNCNFFNLQNDFFPVKKKEEESTLKVQRENST